MSITQHQADAGSATGPHGKRKPRFGTGRSEFVVVAVLYAVAIFLTIGTVTMNVQGKSAPGPQFFPILVCIVLYLAATLLAIQILRTPKVPDNSIHPGHGQFSADMLHDLGHLGQEEDEAYDDAPSQTPTKTWKTYSDWRTVGVLLGGVVAFVRCWNRWAGSSAQHRCSGSSPMPSAVAARSSTSESACSSPQSFNWPLAPPWVSVCPPAS